MDGPDGYQARLTFAMARHAAVDLALVFQTPPLPPRPDRLPEADFARLRESLCGAGVKMREGPAVATALAELRVLYEPFVNALAAYFLFAMPPFQPEKPPVDNWQTSPWTPRSPGLGGLPAAGSRGRPLRLISEGLDSLASCFPRERYCVDGSSAPRRKAGPSICEKYWG